MHRFLNEKFNLPPNYDSFNLPLSALRNENLIEKRNEFLSSLKVSGMERIPSLRELRSVQLLTHREVSKNDNTCLIKSGGTDWSHMYVNESDNSLISTFSPPNSFLSFLELLSVVLYFDEEELAKCHNRNVENMNALSRLHDYVTTTLCLQCNSLLSLSPDVCDSEITHDASNKKLLICLACGFVTKRCMYTDLPLFEWSAWDDGVDHQWNANDTDDGETGNGFQCCHLCKNASCCGNFRACQQEFEWLPFDIFNAHPNTCFYCGIIMLDVL